MAAARELRYNSRSAVYGDLAYDLDREVRERALRHAGEAPRHQTAVEAVPKAKPRVRSLSKAQVRQRQKVSVLSVLGVGAAIGLAVMVLMGYIQLTIISDEVVSLQNQLEELQTENVTLTAQHEQMFDLATVKEVAEAAAVSQRHLERVFFEVCGLSPMAYLLELRLRHASLLLRGTSKTVAEIAGECGFEDPSYFARVFKRKYGAPPNQCRQGPVKYVGIVRVDVGFLSGATGPPVG